MEAMATGSLQGISPASKRGQHNRELLALRQLSQALSGLKDLDSVLRVALDNVLDIVDGFVGGILLLDPKTQTLTYSVHHGLSAAYVEQAHYQLGQGIVGIVAQTGKPILLEDVSSDSRVAYPELVHREGMHAFISVPLKSKGTVLGVLHIASHQPREYSVNDMHLLNLVADYISIAIEQANLYERYKRGGELYRKLARQVLVAQEDEQRRIARELHDETGQTLAGLALQLQVLSLMAEKEHLDAKFVTRIKQIQALAVQAHSEIRGVIANLHPSVLDTLGLVDAVQQLVDSNLRPIGIDCDVRITGDVRDIPGQIETSLFRVIQGTVGNVAQHSKAKHSSVTLEYGQEQLRVTVTDDGVGFDLSKIVGVDGDGRGMGLLSMKERVGILGGTCFIKSEIGKGTTALVSVPIPRRGEDGEDKSTAG